MLQEFFRLDEPFRTFDTEALVSHFKISNDLRSVLYEPDHWPSDLRKVKELNFKNVSLSKTQFRNVTFTSCQFEDCLFIGSIFSNIEFHRCTFTNCNFYKAEFANCYIDPLTISFDRRYRRVAANVGVQLYHQLLENGSSTKQSRFEMTADIEFRKWRRWQLRYDYRSAKITRWGFAAEWLRSCLYEYAAGFGYRPLRFVVATILLFSAISILNAHMLPGALQQDGQVVERMTIADSVFYTYSMLTALGFSTIIPTTAFARVLAVFEALTGIGWLGIFTSLLVKRFIR
jgi:hypothetical protein